MILKSAVNEAHY